MRKHLITGALAVLLSGGPAVANGISGVFQTAPNDDGNVGHVEFTRCGETYCGALIASFGPGGDAIPSPNTGKNIVWDMQDLGEGRFGKGKIWDPGADKTYRSKMQLEGDTLSVSGCVGPICRKNKWTRVK